MLFAQEVLLFEPDDWQKQALMDLAESPKVAIKSGQGVGKTGMEAVALLWFLCCYPYPRIVATAPTKQQLHDVLWSEVSKWMSKSPLLSDILKWTKTYIYMVGNEKRWFAVARTATKPENMQGFHEDNMLFIVDEASGVADPIMEAILGTLSGANNKLLMCGNPTRTSGTFYDAFNVDRSIYRCHTVSSADSKRTNKQNIESLIRKYGRDSNVVLVRVFGEFPKQEDDVFIALSIVEHCCMLDLPDDVPIKRISFGVDVARYGSDETVIAKNVGGRITLPVSFRGQSLMTTVGKIVQLYRQAITEFPRYRGKIYINIDDCGLGGGVTDRLEEVKQEEKLTRMVIVPVNAAGKVPEETLGDGKQKACDIYDKSYKVDCTLPRENLRYIHVLHVGFDNQVHEGELVVNKDIADDVLEIFKELYESGYQIEKVRLVDEYDADDESSMSDNNSSAFNFRFISHTTKISKHGMGMAVDINTLYNPYVKTVDGELSIEPANGADYVDRSKDFSHKIDHDDLCYKLFTEHGFEWGGDWSHSKDYQHFEK